MKYAFDGMTCPTWESMARKWLHRGANPIAASHSLDGHLGKYNRYRAASHLAFPSDKMLLASGWYAVELTVTAVMIVNSNA